MMKIPFLNRKPTGEVPVADSFVGVPNDDFVLHELIPRSVTMNKELLARKNDENMRKQYGVKKRKSATIQ
jgi:hypothetical protein